jgi:hypothetical protein
MSWIQGTATNHEEVIEALHDFATKATKAGTPGYIGTGDGDLLGQSSTADSVVETITITCTTGGVGAIFSVIGSTTGALPDATSNVLYNESVISFFISEGSVDYIVSDEFTISVTAITPIWSANRYVHTPGSDYELLLNSAGVTTTDDIFIGLQSYDTTLNYGFRVNGFSGYNAASNFLNQPGAVAGNVSPWDHHFVPTTNSALTYWFFVSPNRIMATFLSGAVYTGFYLGWIKAFATPSQWNYPMCVGSCSYDIRSYTDTDSLRHHVYWNSDGDTDDAATLSILDSNAWVPANQDSDVVGGKTACWPFKSTDLSLYNIYQNNEVVTFPAIAKIDQDNKAGVYGEFEGIRAPSTLAGSLTVEDVLTDSSYGAGIVFQDVFRASQLALYVLQED